MQLTHTLNITTKLRRITIFFVICAHAIFVLDKTGAKGRSLAGLEKESENFQAKDGKLLNTFT